MPVRTVEVHDYQRYLGGDVKAYGTLSPIIQRIIKDKLVSCNATKVDVYNLSGKPHRHGAGIKDQRVVIFFNAVAQGSAEDLVLAEPQKINGLDLNCTVFHSPLGDGVLIASKEGLPLAEWREKTWELNILFDLYSGVNIDNANAIFTFIMEQFEELVWYAKLLENSWKYTKNKKQLTERFTARIKEQKEHVVREDKRLLENWENKVEQFRREIKTLSDSIQVKRRSLASEQENIKNVSENLIKDLDMIINNEKFEDVQIIDKKFVFFTAPITIYADNGKKYYGGKFRVEANIENSDIRFFGDTKRHGYWTNNDPHPHVNGSGGSACLGNVSSTIAELCSQTQIYALALILIDFLEQANTSDPAGRNVINWDEIKDDGTVLKKTQEAVDEAIVDEDDDREQCDHCGEMVDEVFQVFEGTEEDEDGNFYGIDERYVCEDCRSAYYHWDDEIEIYVRD